MKGLLKNNYFAVRSNAKAFSVFMLLLGIFVVAVISPSLLMGYALLGMIGFSLNAMLRLSALPHCWTKCVYPQKCSIDAVCPSLYKNVRSSA